MIDVLNVLLLPPVLFYNTLIINSVRYAYFCRYFYRNSAVTCARTSLFLAIYSNKKSLHSIGGVLSVLSPQSENERLLLDVIIYIILYIIIL